MTNVQTLDRYFVNKTDCVLQTAEWIGQNVRNANPYPASLFTDGEHTGADILKMYMEKTKALYIKTSRIFVLRAEFKNFVYRNCNSVADGWDRLTNALGCYDLMKRIYTLGVKDGSFSDKLDIEMEANYFCEAFLGFLSHLALSDDPVTERKIMKIDRYISHVTRLYEIVKRYPIE